MLIEMLLNLLHIKIPHALVYYSTRMMLAAATSLLLSIFLGPYFIRWLWALKVGQTIRVEECPLLGELHRSKKDTPTMGGVLILSSIFVSMLLWMDLSHIFTLILMITMILLGCLGGVDDYLKLKYKSSKGLRGKWKMGVQLFLSGTIAYYLLSPSFQALMHIGEWFSPPLIKSGSSMLSLSEAARQIYLPFFKEPVFILTGVLAVFSFILIILCITGASNAVNLTDGLDGLAAGSVLMVALAFTVIAFVSNHAKMASYLNILYIEGSGEIAIFLSAMVGACLGFLWYNGHPAQVFMGDTGSLALGGALGVSAVLLRREFLLAVIGGVFVMEALSVILQVGSYRLRGKKRIFLIAPLHHHFEYKGWAETKVVIRFWILGFLLAILGLFSLKLQ